MRPHHKTHIRSLKSKLRPIIIWQQREPLLLLAVLVFGEWSAHVWGLLAGKKKEIYVLLLEICSFLYWVKLDLFLGFIRWGFATAGPTCFRREFVAIFHVTHGERKSCGVWRFLAMLRISSIIFTDHSQKHSSLNFARTHFFRSK